MKSREANYLGAFLHDIGKFRWRAEEYRQGQSETHESYGLTFIKSNLKDFAIFSDQSEFMLLESGYKGTTSKMKAADIITAKAEREADEKHPDKTRRPLISIFSRVDIGKPNANSYKEYEKEGVWCIDPEPLGFNAQVPVVQKGKDKNWLLSDAEQKSMIEKHRGKWLDFQRDVSKLRNISDFRTFFTSFYKICEKYTSTVCSAGYASVPDLTLFDHSRAVAALCNCLDEADRDEHCLVIKGDISGIQNFIYRDIEMKESPAKLLRGRSFFIKLLTDAVSNYLLREFDAFDANILINSGGHFVMIVPNNKANRDKYEELEKNINIFLFHHFGAELFLVMASIEVTGKRLYEEFSKVQNDLEKNIYAAKKRKCFSILDELMLQTLPPTDDKIFDKELIDKLGELLPKSKYLIEIHTNKPLHNKDVISFDGLGLAYKLSEENYPQKDLEGFDQAAISSVIIHNIKSTQAFGDLGVDYQKDYPIGYSFKFTGSFIPSNNGSPLTFEELAEIESKDYPLLGIARMDVDSLGKIFSSGLRGDEDDSGVHSISRIANMSRELEHFFAGHIISIADKNNIYLVYSGGDDLFAVGSWIKIIKFVQQVKKEFNDFVCNNQNLTISGGVFFSRPSYPIARSARAAGSLEDKAKKKHTNKDHISLFNREVKWKTLTEMIDVGNKLFSVVNDNLESKEKIPRSFIHNLLSLTQSCIDKTGGLLPDRIGKATARIHYAFARRDVDAIEIEKKSLGYKTTLAEHFITTDAEERKKWFYNFVIPASYVLLKTRKLEK